MVLFDEMEFFEENQNDRYGVVQISIRTQNKIFCSDNPPRLVFVHRTKYCCQMAMGNERN